MPLPVLPAIQLREMSAPIIHTKPGRKRGGRRELSCRQCKPGSDDGSRQVTSMRGSPPSGARPAGALLSSAPARHCPSADFPASPATIPGRASALDGNRLNGAVSEMRRLTSRRQGRSHCIGHRPGYLPKRLHDGMTLLSKCCPMAVLLLTPMFWRRGRLPALLRHPRTLCNRASRPRLPWGRECYIEAVNCSTPTGPAGPP